MGPQERQFDGLSHIEASDRIGFSREQLALFNKDTLRACYAFNHHPQEAQAALEACIGQEVVVFDLGGDGARLTTLTVDERARLRASPKTTRTHRAKDGVGVLSFLEEVAEELTVRGTPIGISTAGSVDGTVLNWSPNLMRFVKELHARYDGDLRSLLPTLKVVTNDAVGGLLAGSVEVWKQMGKKDVIFVINGGGLGGSVLKAGEVWATEPGHIELLPELNIFDQTKPCGVEGALHVCLEVVAASGAGIEDLWEKKTGQKASGREISAIAMTNFTKSGDQYCLSRSLYYYSALMTAHAIVGMGEAFRLFNQEGDTAVVCHGGCFEVPFYGDWVKERLQQRFGYEPPVFLTKTFSPNACLEGIAIAALRDVPSTPLPKAPES